MAVRTECTFTLKINCTASLISVLVAFGATWNTSVFWFSLIARPFSVITGRRMIWYALFIRPPPPLFHSVAGGAVHASASSPPHPRLRQSCASFLKPSSSARLAVSQLPDARRSPGHIAVGGRDVLHFPVPARVRRCCA